MTNPTSSSPLSLPFDSGDDMKRDNQGVPVSMKHQWPRPTLSCQPCRDKKRRCDRKWPCSNCAIRNCACEYDQGAERPAGARQAGSAAEQIEPSHKEPRLTATTAVAPKHAQSPAAASLSNEEILARLHRLEAAVFDPSIKRPGSVRASLTAGTEARTTDKGSPAYTIFNAQSAATPAYDPPDGLDYVAYAVSHLPPLDQARILFQHSGNLQLNFHVLHVPSSRALVEQTYKEIEDGDRPAIASVLLLFAMFAAAALTWTPELLDKLHAGEAEAEAARDTYAKWAYCILENTHDPIPASRTALEAISCLTQVTTHLQGVGRIVLALRAKFKLMAQEIGVHRLDTDASREERTRNGEDGIQTEVLRRVWWNMVATDWLTAFNGGPQDGTYMFHPNHMLVSHPGNIDDVDMKSTGIQPVKPLSNLTSMSYYLYRLRLATVCREVIDSMPLLYLDPESHDYSSVLRADRKFQDILEDLPVYMRLDPESIRQSQHLSATHPDFPVAQQRLDINFAIHTRLCHLHRPYHLKSSTDAVYTQSRESCLYSAKRVIELRQSMDSVPGPVHLKPDRSWIAMQHVFLATVSLASDVAFHPEDPRSEGHKSQVLAACRVLQRLEDEGSPFMEDAKQKLQTIMAALQQRREQDLEQGPPARNSHLPVAGGSQAGGPRLEGDKTGNAYVQDTGDLGACWDNVNAVNAVEELLTSDNTWDHLLSDFLTVAPDLDSAQWRQVWGESDGW